MLNILILLDLDIAKIVETTVQEERMKLLLIMVKQLAKNIIFREASLGGHRRTV